MKITKGCESIVNRWNTVMMSVGCEHVTINTYFSEIEKDISYYNGKMINIKWLIDEADYWLSCYREPGNCRCDDRFESKDDYRIWVSETGKLKRLISYLRKYDLNLVIARVEE